MKIAVLGGGHGCYAAAADLSEAGHEVRLWRRDGAALQPVIDAGSIVLKDVQGVREVRLASATADMDEAVRIFEINLSPLAGGRLNYLRATSAAGAAQYRPGLRVTTEAFGEVAYSGGIAVLHIDGNHSYEHAAEDARLWTPHVKPGGWIIFDDYFWVFGDGPRRVGDAFLEEDDRIQVSFVAGKALFVQLKA